MMGRLARVAAIVVAVFGGSFVFAAGSSSAGPSTVVMARTTDTPVTGPVVVGIGDSILAGHGLAEGQSWLADLSAAYGWRLTNLASDGSGFVTVGDNGDTFSDQVKAAVQLNPDMIVISGSSNDLGSDDASIRDATVATISAIHAALPATKIIAVSAVWGDTAMPPQLDQITADVAAAARAVGGTYLDIGQPLAGQPDLMQPDDEHPTADGQLALASAVATAISDANVTP